jgi:hypothetical protein
MLDPRDDLEEHRPDAPPGLYFTRRGNWFHDGQRVRHERLAGLLSRSVARDADGRLIVTTGRDVLPFVAEDAPIVVRTIAIDTSSIVLHLSDGTEEHLDGAVVVDDDGQLRTPVRGRLFWARFSRAARQGLEPWFVDEAHLAVGGRTWDVVAATSRTWSAAP